MLYTFKFQSRIQKYNYLFDYDIFQFSKSWVYYNILGVDFEANLLRFLAVFLPLELHSLFGPKNYK